jgi:hypothetical protein
MKGSGVRVPASALGNQDFGSRRVNVRVDTACTRALTGALSTLPDRGQGGYRSLRCDGGCVGFGRGPNDCRVARSSQRFISAARLVFGQIVDAELILEAAADAQRVQLRGGADRLFAGHLATWEAQRQALARVLNIVDFNLIQAAFASLKHIDDVIAEANLTQDADGGWGNVLRDPYHRRRIDTLAEARKIATAASLRLRERVRLIWRDGCQGVRIDFSHARWVVGVRSAGWVAVRQAVRDARSD